MDKTILLKYLLLKESVASIHTLVFVKYDNFS